MTEAMRATLVIGMTTKLQNYKEKKMTKQIWYRLGQSTFLNLNHAKQIFVYENHNEIFVRIAFERERYTDSKVANIQDAYELIDHIERHIKEAT
jgi:hypothetical protein